MRAEVKPFPQKTLYLLPQKFDYPAFCVKCKSHSRVRYAHGVIFKNGRKALRGQCLTCGCEAYKILPHNRQIAVKNLGGTQDILKTIMIYSFAFFSAFVAGVIIAKFIYS
jgi:hypothetical protein